MKTLVLNLVFVLALAPSVVQAQSVGDKCIINAKSMASSSFEVAAAIYQLAPEAPEKPVTDKNTQATLLKIFVASVSRGDATVGLQERTEVIISRGNDEAGLSRVLVISGEHTGKTLYVASKHISRENSQGQAGDETRDKAAIEKTSAPKQPTSATPPESGLGPAVLTGYRLGMTKSALLAQAAKEPPPNEIHQVKTDHADFAYRQDIVDFEFDQDGRLERIRIRAHTEDDFVRMKSQMKEQYGNSPFSSFTTFGTGMPCWHLHDSNRRSYFLLLERNRFWTGSNSDYGRAVYLRNSPMDR